MQYSGLKNISLLWLFCAILLCNSSLSAQGINLGTPPIRNFSKKTYRAGIQNWDAVQDARGALFFANNEGLLEFDGNRWTCYPVANKTVVRAVAIDRQGKIYVGAQNELGYFFPAANGQLQYHSLLGHLPADKRNFEDVWDIVVLDRSVYYRTKHLIFEYNGEHIRMHEPGGELTAMFLTPHGLLIQRNLSELLCLQNGSFQPFLQSVALQSELTGAMPWQGDTLLFSTLKNGLFALTDKRLVPWQTPHDAHFRLSRIYSATALPNGHLALATSLDGLYEIDRQRRIYRHFTKKTGLQNNNILHAFADRAGNVWLGLNNGIDCIALLSPFSSIIPDGELQGTGYAAAVFDGQLYLGVSNGVYRTDWNTYINPEKKPLFDKINATDGQVWALGVLGDELLMGHHEGSFRLNKEACTRVSTEPGAWNFVPLEHDYMVSGSYKGLNLYRKQAGHWTFGGALEGLQESSRFVVRDADGAVWVAHPYRGLFRVMLRSEAPHHPEVRFFNAANGLPSDNNNFVFSIAGKAVFATEKGVYRFDNARSVFVADEDFSRLLGAGNPIRYLKEDAGGNIWYVGQKEVGRLEVQDWGLKKEVVRRVFPQLSEKLVAGFEYIFPADAANVFFGAEQGFIHFDASAPGSADTTLSPFFSRITVRAAKDSVLFGGYFMENGRLTARQTADRYPVLKAHMNNLVFSCTAPYYEDPGLILYRYKLEGLEKEWSEWTSEQTRSFTNLSPGRYRFMAQAMLKNGRAGEIATYSFRIDPPWYAGTAATVVYLLAGLGTFFGFLIRQRRKFEHEKENLNEQHQQITARQQLEVEQSKAALSDALREKLEVELQFKNKELASATMHLVQKGEILQTIQENLKNILEKSNSAEAKKEVRQLLNLLDFDANLDEDWAHFALHFDQVHVDFLKRLRERHPQLSSTDFKLCAYLRMNLTSKEIAPLMNISVRGVEASRYRLRKKLGLPNDANLTEVIAAL